MKKLLILLSLFPLFAHAQEEVQAPPSSTRASYISIGYTDILDTYLSQEKNTGTEVRYIGSREKALTKHPDWLRVTTNEVYVSLAGTRGNGDCLLSATYNFHLGWLHQWQLPAQHLTLQAGGLIDGILGGAYNTRNTNNPAQARIALSIDPAAQAAWDFRIRQRLFRLNYEVSVPLLGAAFSPNYGQSYYEIFSRGNYDHNVVVTQPFNAPSLRQMLTLDFRLWRTVFSVGYLGDYRQMKINNLKYHQWTHTVVLGWKL